MRIYHAAALQLFDLVRAVREAVSFDETPVSVSHSGGLFHAAKYVLPVLTQKLASIDCVLCRPEQSPIWGACMMARAFAGEAAMPPADLPEI